MKFNKDILWKKDAMHGFTNATDAADYLVKLRLVVPFRGAHSIASDIFFVLTFVSKREKPLMK